MQQWLMDQIDTPQARRRTVLRALLLGAGTLSAPGLLSACGNSSADTATAGAGTNTAPTAAQGARLAQQLPLQAGPLANIGPLVPTGVDNVFAPEGFSIRAVARHLSNPVLGIPDPLGVSGYNWHIFPDGGAVYPTDDGGWVYVSNSETDGPAGGVGALRFNASGEVADSYRILDGTRRNCAGGATPWGTWLSCEEVVDGLVYECNPLGTTSDARPLPALGLFNHEAAAVDITTNTIYLTEDAGDGRLYRFVCAEGLQPAVNGRPALNMQEGKLQALEIEGFEAGAYPENLADVRTIKRAKWVDVVEPSRVQAQVRNELLANGQGAPGTQFRGGEGIWIQEFEKPVMVEGADKPMRSVVFFACKGDNRVYALDIDNDLIEVVFDNEQLGEEPGFDDVDNLVVSPAGDVIVAEDGDAMRLMVMVPNQPAKILLQITGGGSELTGPAFTPDGSKLYFSSQRGPNIPNPTELPNLPGTGVTYELSIPERFRKTT